MWRPPWSLPRGSTRHKGRALVQLLFPLCGQPLKTEGASSGSVPLLSARLLRTRRTCSLGCHSLLLQLWGTGAWARGQGLPLWTQIKLSDLNSFSLQNVLGGLGGQIWVFLLMLLLERAKYTSLQISQK